jgi:hypothetical protein
MNETTGSSVREYEYFACAGRFGAGYCGKRGHHAVDFCLHRRHGQRVAPGIEAAGRGSDREYRRQALRQLILRYSPALCGIRVGKPGIERRLDLRARQRAILICIERGKEGSRHAAATAATTASPSKTAATAAAATPAAETRATRG